MLESSLLVNIDIPYCSLKTQLPHLGAMAQLLHSFGTQVIGGAGVYCLTNLSSTPSQNIATAVALKAGFIFCLFLASMCPAKLKDL